METNPLNGENLPPTDPVANLKELLFKIVGVLLLSFPYVIAFIFIFFFLVLAFFFVIFPSFN